MKPSKIRDASKKELVEYIGKQFKKHPEDLREPNKISNK